MDKKVLLVYYSRTGTTKKVAEEICKLTGCDVEEIVDTKDRTGVIGYLASGKDATLKKLTQLKETIKSPNEYDLVIIGTPVWAFTMSAPIRAYITDNKHKFKNVAFFCTQGSSGSDGTFKDMEKLCELKPTALLELKTKEVIKEECDGRIEEFVGNI